MDKLSGSMCFADYIFGFSTASASFSWDCALADDISAPKSVIRMLMVLLYPFVVCTAFIAFFVLFFCWRGWHYAGRLCMLSITVVFYFAYFPITRHAIGVRGQHIH